jgi:hypothetical protein
MQLELEFITHTLMHPRWVASSASYILVRSGKARMLDLLAWLQKCSAQYRADGKMVDPSWDNDAPFDIIIPKDVPWQARLAFGITCRLGVFTVACWCE